MGSAYKQLHNLLIKKDLSISTAESCTAWLLSSMLTSASGSSKYFNTGIIAYSNAVKEKILKVNRKLIKLKGAVSKDVALAMAKSIRGIAKTDLGVSITGIAGPTGESKTKPIGLIYIAIADKDGALGWEFKFKGNRNNIRKIAAETAIQLLKQWIQ